MFAENHKISVRQLEILLLLYYFGTTVLFLPSDASIAAGNGSWIITIVWGVASSFLAVLFVYLGERHPSYTAVEWYESSFGREIGTILAFGLGGKIILDGAMELRLFSDVISSSMLPRTPQWLLLALTLILCCMAAAYGLECMARSAEILFFVVLIPLVVVLTFVAISTNYNRILPIQIPAFSSLKESMPFFAPLLQGFMIFLFIFPNLEKRKHMKRRIWLTCMAATCLMTVLVFLCLAVYGTAALSEKLLPTLQMMERVSFSGIFLGRQDLFLLWFWMVTTFLYVTGLLCFGQALCVHIFRGKKTQRNFWLYLLVPLIFIVALLPKDMAGAYWLRIRVAPWLSGIFFVALPILIFFVDGMKRRGRHE